MKNKIFKTLFLFIMIFSLSVCSDVRADDKLDIKDKEAQNDTGRDYENTSGKKLESWWNGNPQGIRITLVDATGKRIAGTTSADYFSTYDYKDNYNEMIQTRYSSRALGWVNYNANAARYGMKKEIVTNYANINMQAKNMTFSTLDFLPYYGLKDECNWKSKVNYGSYFEDYFTNMDNSKLRNILSSLAGGDLDAILPTTNICNLESDWYFVIEPLHVIYMNDYSSGSAVVRTYVGTITELAYIYNSKGRPYGLENWLVEASYGIYMKGNISTYKGFYGVGGINYSIDLSSIYAKDTTRGYALGVFKLVDLFCDPICYKADVKCTTTACDNTDKNNIRTCTKNVVADRCEYSKIEDDYNKMGEKTFTIIENECSLYCTETASVSYPGNIGTALDIYEPFAWPTNGGKYPLTTTATLTCTPMMHNGENANATCLAKLATLDKNNFKYENSTTTAQVKYEHYQYEDFISSDLVQTCEPSNVTVEGGQYKITSNCTYTLPTDENVAISKEKADLINAAAIKYAHTVSNYILITKYNGVLPKSGYSWIDDAHTFESLYDALEKITFSKKYKLKIKNMPLGHNGAFTTLLNDDRNEYVCYYNITLTPSAECICEPGTVWAGTDIYGKIKDTAQTCAEARLIYCNQGELPPSDDSSCPPDSKYPERNCTDYINNGGTEAECIANWCNDTCTTNCDYVCPKTSEYPGMDISACVSGQLGAGKKLAQAQSYCIEKNCYKGAKIIYRTISLENPFPSMDADAKVNQTGLTKGMFNTTIKGRYPGTNWNSVTLVRNKILNNRGYDGSEIYQEAKPLYVIELDPTAIKKIREYNKKQEASGGYSDFTLKCTDGAYCISSFIRSGITTADGTNMLTDGTCATAHNKKTFTSCYTYK